MIFPFIGLELYGQVAKENYQDSIFLDLRGDLRDPEVLGRDCIFGLIDGCNNT